MLAKIADWTGRFWKLIGGAAVLVGLLAGITSLIDFGERRQVTSAPVSAFTDSVTIVPTITPTPLPAPTATMGPFQFISFPEQVIAGEDALLSVQALPGAVCHVEYFTPNGNVSRAIDPDIVVPDSRALCTWEWHIRADTTPGIAKLVIAINDMQETHEFEILPP